VIISINSAMKPGIPKIINLLKSQRHDPDWKGFRLVYKYFDNITGKFIDEILDNIPENQEDYRLYLFDFIIKTRRIFSSIVLLAIYGKLSDMNILYRPLLENIVQTKIFLKSRRTKSVRAINLYRIVNKLKERKNAIEDTLEANNIDIFFEKPDNSIEEIKKLEQELLKYNIEEILKMEKKVENGLAWHGRSFKSGLRECNLVDQFEEYVDSCKFIHVRDYGLTGLDCYCNNNYTKLKLFIVSLNCIYHLDDFKIVCPDSFIVKRNNTKQIDCVIVLMKLISQILLTASPELKDSIEKILKSVKQDINI